ncbi:ATP-binding protein [Rhodoplanes sp. Z2-YC6860]|uniref:ATP-binding protein n=1 Tax=Rhodoplanes sp. Z2-YC6860 TaxID=674703 RepID=UPI00078D1713|nr:ATP-binding protein [Rhodoplanes sp. Z2-YC6860]AMN44717.1 ATPase [Rhodoplanes sp. Z2-YC6860]
MSTVSSTQPNNGVELPPFASVLMQSLRSVGYSAATALADLIDNSLAAKARVIQIAAVKAPLPYVAVIDDGGGMDEQTLVAAMRFGSRDPRDRRHLHDLGRFGLGLKTAALSQCKRLTVVSLANGVESIARWDLDDCDRRGTWWLERPNPSSLPSEPLSMLRQKAHGTAIILEKLDRLDAAGGDNAILSAADHLALAFHRFIGGEFSDPVSISLNGRPLPVVDPFLQDHPRGQVLHDETITIEDHPIKVSPFVLPFPSRLKEADLDRAGGRESLKTSHGFYVYRGGRLVVPGGWFRIVPADDLVRLARIRIDVPVELDHLWKVDIRKAVSEPPQALRPYLRRIVGDVAERSRKVYTHRGTLAPNVEHVPLWRRVEMRDQGAAWRINRDHPTIRAVLENASEKDVVTALKLLEDNLPIQDIHIHTANDQPVAEVSVPDEADLEAMAKQIVEAFPGEPEVLTRILAKLPVTEPFNRNPDAARRIVDRLLQ